MDFSSKVRCIMHIPIGARRGRVNLGSLFWPGFPWAAFCGNICKRIFLIFCSFPTAVVERRDL